MEMTPEQKREAVEANAILAWGNSPHDAVEAGDYCERLIRTRKVFIDAYAEGYKQAQTEHSTAASRLSFVEATVLRARLADVISSEAAAAAGRAVAALAEVLAPLVK